MGAFIPAIYRPAPLGGLPFLDFTPGRTSTNPLSVATTSNLPSGATYDTATGVGRITLTQNVTDWDFRGLNAHFLIGTAGIVISQCLFDLSNYTITNLAFLYTSSSSVYWSLQNCTLDGRKNTSIVTRGIGSDNGNGAPTLIDSNLIFDWPIDIISGIIGVSNRKTTVSKNYMRSVSSGISGLHTDGIQIAGWANGDLEINNNVIDVTPYKSGITGNVDGSTQTSPLNISPSTAFDKSISIHDNLLIGPATGFNMLFADNPGTPTGKFEVDRIWVKGSGFGPLSSNGKATPILGMRNIFDADDGSRLPFSYNNGSSTTSVYSVP